MKRSGKYRFAWARGLLRGLAITALALGFGHLALGVYTTARPPPLSAPAPESVRWSGGIRRYGHSYVKHHGGILQVGLQGSPEELGFAQASLLSPEMLDKEAAVWSVFDQVVPSWPLRLTLLDLARWRFRRLERHFPIDRKRELAAAALLFHPDPYQETIPTWQRFLFLNALYDIGLSFEHSPMIGCSSVALSGSRAVDGHTLLARNFDFNVHDSFDHGKAVFLFRESGKIPFASVAWPGLIGVVTGLNARGVGLVVHGARARSPTPDGEPVLLTVREALSSASTAEQAAALFDQHPPMVSHLVLVVDAAGTILVVERAPGTPSFVRRGTHALALSNHLEGPLASDPANLRVRANTSTLDRRARLDELLSSLEHPASPTDLVRFLRDRKAAGGAPLPPGDPRAVDANIATHGVILDATARRLWVSEGPHLNGRFLRFDLARLLDDSYDPEEDLPLDPIP